MSKIVHISLILNLLCAHALFAVERPDFDLEGPDFIQRPKYYQTLEMILANSGLIETDRLHYQFEPLKGSKEILVILLEFADVPHNPEHTPDYFHKRFFSEAPPQRSELFS